MIMSRFSMIVLILGIVMPYMIFAQEATCGDNEEFHSCGTACPATCDNPNAPNQPCTLQCVIGCFCKPGYLRNNDGKCVSPNEC